MHEAQRVSEKITAPDGDLQKHRLAVNQLASQALETQATVETLRKEKAAYDDLRVLLQVVHRGSLEVGGKRGDAQGRA